MYGEDHKLLERLVELAEDSNRILHQMRRANRWANFFTFIKWLVIIALSLGFYYYLDPYLKPIMDFYQNVVPGLTESTKNLDFLGKLNLPQ